MSVFFVYLRQPGGLDDRRNDPFWEFGSFGRTGCHSKNLLHPKNSRIVDGDRLAFLQGGNGEIRVVGLTPPIRVAGTTERIELKWDKVYRPVPFVLAPILINNDGDTAFATVHGALRLADTNRPTFCGSAASRLRSRATAVSHDLAHELVQWFSGSPRPKIVSYPEAIQVDTERWHQNAIKLGWASARLKFLTASRDNIHV
ncbi:MAG: hypothetical protein ABSH33_24090 [Steroidobacteraceae bacterium]|jgi:hypothetical protein